MRRMSSADGWGTKRERVLASFIFILWLMAVVFPLLNINLIMPASQIGSNVYLLVVVYLTLNGVALLYSLYMLGALAHRALRRKMSAAQWWRIALYLYAVIGISIAIYLAVQAIF